MNSCEEFIEAAVMMIDGELDAPSERELLAHLELCAECRTVYETFKGLSQGIGTTLEHAPPDFARGTMYRIHMETDGASKKRGRFAFGSFTAIAACLAIVIFAVSQTGTVSEIPGTASTSADNVAGSITQAAVVEESGGGTGEIDETYTLITPFERNESVLAPAPAQTAAEEDSAATLPAETAQAEMFAEMWTQYDEEAALWSDRYLREMSKAVIYAAGEDSEPAAQITDGLPLLARLLSWSEIGERVSVEGAADYTVYIYPQEGEPARLELWIINGMIWYGSGDSSGWAFSANGAAFDFLEILEES